MKLLLSLGLVASAVAKDAFVFLGATGDNALRESGVFHGLYESYAAGGVVDIFLPSNSPNTEGSIQQRISDTLTPLYTKLKANPAWKCKAHHCDPASFIKPITINIHHGYESCAQAAELTPLLAGYERISVYLSIPPKVFGEWATCAAKNWGADRVHIAAEKPFGISLADADARYTSITDVLPSAQLHLVDHWLSFFMNRHMSTFTSIATKALGIRLDRRDIERVVVTEFEERGLEGRGGFFDGVGQVRDMVQSHLLQVLALTLVDDETESNTKIEVLNATTVKECLWGQYDGFLLEPKLTYHAGYADSTYCDVVLDVDLPEWYGVPMHIVTGKDMGLLKYTVELYQRDGPGLLTIEIGKEETGTAGVKVSNWPLVDESPFEIPVGGFETATTTAKPAVTKGNGYIVEYTNRPMYFPCPYALMLAGLVGRQYDAAFATYAECRRGWEIISATSDAACMDPVPQQVPVYKIPSECGQTPPAVCWQVNTVKDMYNTTFACSAAHDKLYANASLYQAKCHPSPSTD